MGRSLSAELRYGYVLYSEEQWHLEEAGEYGSFPEHLGVPEEHDPYDFLEHRLKHADIEDVALDCVGWEYEERILIIKDAGIKEYGTVHAVNLPTEPPPNADALLSTALFVLGITPKAKPSWILIANYG